MNNYPETQYTSWLETILAIVQEASQSIIEIYTHKKYQIEIKPDNSPVTEADLLSHRIIEAGLKRLDPSIPFISEESHTIPYEERKLWSRFWLVDPLDGTREFIQNTGEFTINIALIEDHIPVLGVVVAPILGHTYWAIRGGPAFFKDSTKTQIIKTRPEMEFPIKIAKSRHHREGEIKYNQLLEKIKQSGAVEIIYCGSALKICLVAQGLVHLYPRFGSTGQWDTAAGQCILEAAGGQLINLHGNSLRYNESSSLINPEFCAISSAELINFCCG